VFSGVEEGARNTLWACCAARGEGAGEVRSGEFYTPVGVGGNGSRWCEDEGLAGRLWEWTEGELDAFLGDGE